MKHVIEKVNWVPESCQLRSRSPRIGATAYVANANSGTVTPISTATNTPGTAINAGRHPEAVAITP